MNQLSPHLTELAAKHPCRYTRDQKNAFLLDAKRVLRKAGCSDEQITEQRLGGVFGSRNLIIGNEDAEYLVTAHYDTPGRNGFLLGTSSLVGQTGANIIMMALMVPFLIGEVWLVKAAMDVPDSSLSLVIGAILALPVLMILLMLAPMLIRNRTNVNDNTSGAMCVLQCALLAAKRPELWEHCCFVLFDNEEWGLLGSQGFATQRQKRKVDEKSHFVINLDCVGVGDVLAAVTTGKPGSRCEELTGRLAAQGYNVECKQSQLVFMSDHAIFPDAVMLCMMSRSKLGPLYIPNIHSRRDTECDNGMVVKLAEDICEHMGNLR